MLVETATGMRDTESGKEYRVEPLYPDTMLYPDTLLYPGGMLVEVEALAPLRSLSVEVKIALLLALLKAYEQARSTLDDLSPTTGTANMMFAVAVAAILGLAIIER